MLEIVKSNYYNSFARLCKDVGVAVGEASSNVKYLTTLADLLSKVSSGADFKSLPELFRPLLYRVMQAHCVAAPPPR